MGESEEVGAGILRLVAALENEGNASGQGRQEGGSPALCFLCGPLAKGSEEVKLLSEEQLVVLLRTLLVSPEDEVEILRRMEVLVNANVCGKCDKSLGTLVNLYQQLESARLEFCGLRRRVGHQMISGSLRMPESFGKWLTDVKSVKDVFPSKAPKKLRRSIMSKDVAIGTDEVVKVEEDECDFDMIPGDAKVETEDGDERLKSRANKGVDSAAGSSRKGASENTEKDVSLTSMKTCRVMLERIREVPATNSRPATPRKRRRATNESETKNPSCGQQGTKRVAGNGEGSADEVESPERATPKQDGSRVNGGSRDLPSTSEKLRRAIAMKKKKRSSHADGRQKRGSKFTRKLLTISRSVKVPNKTSGGIHYYRRCKFCPKLCGNYYIMRRHCYGSHKTKYLKDLPFVCLLCYKLFPSTNTLEVHMKEHESLRCPTCDWCDKYFHSQRNLKRHMMIHTGEKPYACDVCSQKFSREDKAKAHMATHTGVKPFVCSCGREYTWKQSLNKHKTTTGHL